MANRFIADVHSLDIGAPDKIYDVTDYATMRMDILDGVRNAVASRFPLENERYQLTVDDLQYPKTIQYSKKEQKQAILEGRSLTVPLKGRWKLMDRKSKAVINESNPRLLMNVPYMTERGTFIRNGNENTMPLQLRLVPGVFTRIRDNGEPEAHVNVKSGSGNMFKMSMDPSTGVFYIRSGGRKIKAYPLLRAMGVDDRTIAGYWGRGLMENNLKVAYGGQVRRSMQQLSKEAADTAILKKAVPDDKDDPEDDITGLSEEQKNSIRKTFGRMELDPISTQHTLGMAFKRVNPEMLMLTAKKLSELTKANIVPDVRDSLLNQRVYSPPDIFAERILKDAGGTGRRILWKATNKGGVDQIPAGILNDYISGVFNETRLTQATEECNPTDILSRNTRITKMGQGGIGDIRAAGMDARLVQNSYKGFIDSTNSPESLKAGLDSQLAMGVKKGSDGLLYTKMINMKTGQPEWVNTIKASRSNVAIPGYDEDLDYVPVMKDEGVEYIKKTALDYKLPSGDSMFSVFTNLIPFKSAINAGRALMAAKHVTQALSLTDREAPLVRTLGADGRSVEEGLGTALGAIRAEKPGRAVYVGQDHIRVLNDDGTTDRVELYDSFPYNRKTFISNKPAVKAGQRFNKGALLASSNYTDNEGIAALGTNVRTAYMPYYGGNYRDAYVISDNAAQKFKSEHLFNIFTPSRKNIDLAKGPYRALYPGKYTKEQWDSLDDSGLIRPGTVVRQGDPVAVAVQRNEPSVGTMGRKTYADRASEWEHPFPGVVTDSVKGPKGHIVYVRTHIPAQAGDKIVGRMGNKGVISKVIPSEQMPKDSQGNPIDVLVPSVGMISRLNPNQIYETLLGKIAAKTGKPYVVPGFMDGSIADFVAAELKKNGVEEREDIDDPISGRKIPGVTTGVSYFYKLHHTAEGKAGTRSTGGYSIDELPATGGHEGAKRLGGLVLGALVGHNAQEVLKDSKLIRGRRNDEFWADYRMGKTPAMPGTPMIYKKFLAHLKGAGINVHEDGDRTSIYGLTRQDIDKMQTAEVQNPETYDSKNFQPLKGGLFGPDIFGPDGNVWGHIKLDAPVPNPVMEDGIRSILGLTKSDFLDVLHGRKELMKDKTGGAAIRTALEKVDLNKEIESGLLEIKNSRGARRDAAIKKLRYVGAMKENGVSPADFMLDRIPVIPPMFRSISTSGDGRTMVADANYLYKDLIETRDDARAAKGVLPAEQVLDSEGRIYSSFRALTGLSDPEGRKLEEKNVGGLLKWVFGKASPKWGNYHRNILGTTMDVTGRAVVTPNSSLKLDQVGLPEDQAWGLYEPFIVRKLVMRGWKVADAVKAVTDRKPEARNMMVKVMVERPLLITRAPALHKYSIMAMRPTLIKGHTLQVSPSIVEPFNLDYDGDQMSYYVPVSDKAVKEAYARMLPSKNLLGARQFKAHYLPLEEYVMGAYVASRRRAGPIVGAFKTVEEARQAYRKGQIKVDDNIRVGEPAKV